MSFVKRIVQFFLRDKEQLAGIAVKDLNTNL